MHVVSRTCSALLVCALAGCAAQQQHRDGRQQISEGQIERGLESLRQASLGDPNNLQYRLDYLSALSEQARRLIKRGEDARASGNPALARQAFDAVLKLDPDNERARRGLAEIAMDARHVGMLGEAETMLVAGNLGNARNRINLVLTDNPANTKAQLLLRRLTEEQERETRAKEAAAASHSALKKPVSLQFRDANLRMVFEALSRTTGLNVIFDRDVRPDLKTTIFVRDGSVEDTVDLILLQNQLEKKILNGNTMFIYPSTAAKQKEYLDLKVRTFRISNGDVKYLQNVLKNVLKVREVLVDERTNTLVLRDTADALAVAAKIIGAHDVPDAEVMLEVQVLEVSHDRLTNLGIKWPDALTISTPATSSGALTIGTLKGLTIDDLLATPLQLGLNLKLQDTDANILASPRIRVRDRDKARILIGDKVPVITNTVTPVQTGSAVVTGSIQYLDVGIKLEAEPRVYAEGDVGIKLNLEVSNIVKEIAGPSGSLAYQIGTRSASTSLRLRDGETQILGGLISDSDRNTAAKVPGLGQLPVLGRLFSNHTGNNTKSEVVLSITPHIVRAQGIAEESMRDTWSGTEAAIREAPLRLDPITTVRGAATGTVTNAAPPGPQGEQTKGGIATAAGPAVAAPASAAATKSSDGGAGSGTGTGAGGSGAPLTDNGASRPRNVPSTSVPYAPATPPAPTTPVDVSNLPPSVRPGGAFRPAPPAIVVPPPEPKTPPPSESVAVPSEDRLVDGEDAPMQNETARAVAASAAAQVGKTLATSTKVVGGGLANGSNGGPEVNWVPPGSIKTGERFKVALNAAGFDGIRKIPLVVRYDPLVLSFVEASLGEVGIRAGAAKPETVVDPGSGRVNVILNAGKAARFAGGGELVNFVFSARLPRMQTHLQLAQINLEDGSERRTIARPKPLILKVNP